MKGRLPCVAIALSTLAALTVSAQASAQDRYAGTWRIEKSEPAPWATSADPADPKEVKGLTGATVEFKADRIVGPAPLACNRPHYQIKQYAADMLFQGELDERATASNSADQQAGKLGFGKHPIPTIVTGCASEIEFHALDDDHLLFGLNNTIYRLIRTTPAPAKAAAKGRTP